MGYVDDLMAKSLRGRPEKRSERWVALTSRSPNPEVVSRNSTQNDGLRERAGGLAEGLVAPLAPIFRGHQGEDF